MDIISSSRHSGKTKALIDRAAKDFLCIVCLDPQEATRITEIAKIMGLDIPLPLSFGEFVAGDFPGRGLKGHGIRGFVIDNADLLIHRLAREVPVEALSFTESSVIGEVKAERRRQDEKWGGPEADDRRKSVEAWLLDIEAYVAWCRQMYRMGSPDKYRRRMIQVAALVVAALESHDRLQSVGHEEQF